MATPVRYPSGVTNVKPSDAAANMPMPSRTRLQIHFDDFMAHAYGTYHQYIGTTLAGVTWDIVDGAGGIMRAAITAVTDDYATLTQMEESWTCESGKRMWFGIRYAVSAGETSNKFGFGLAQMATDYVGTTPAEGIFFRIDNDTNLDISINTGGAAAASATAIDTVVAAAWSTAEIEFDGVSAFKYFIDGAHVGTLTTTSFPTTELTLFIYAEAAGATASSSAGNFDIDWVYVAKERTSVND
jgi:hypothetical protein